MMIVFEASKEDQFKKRTVTKSLADPSMEGSTGSVHCSLISFCSVENRRESGVIVRSEINPQRPWGER